MEATKQNRGNCAPPYTLQVIHMKQEESFTGFTGWFTMIVTAIEDEQFYRAAMALQDIEDALYELNICEPTIERIEIMHEVNERNPPVFYSVKGYCYQNAVWTQETYWEDRELYTETSVEVPNKYTGETSIEFNGLRIQLEFLEFRKNEETECGYPF